MAVVECFMHATHIFSFCEVNFHFPPISHLSKSRLFCLCSKPFFLSFPFTSISQIFCQIAKQTTKNPSTASCEQGWQLMLICLATFPPGPLLRDHLMAHCAENSANHPEAKIKV